MINKEKPLTLENLSKAYDLLSKEKPSYDLVIAPEERIKNLIASLPHATSGIMFGMPIIKLPEIERKGLLKWRLFRMLFSSTKKIIEEWHWNHKIYLVSKI